MVNMVERDNGIISVVYNHWTGMVDWNGVMEWWNCKFSKMRSKGHNVIKCLVDNFGIQVDADIKFSGDECAKGQLATITPTFLYCKQ